ANRYLQQVYLPLWNERFSCLPAKAEDAHRPLLSCQRLASILSVRATRTISHDYTLRWRGQVWQIPRAEVRPGMRNGVAQVEQRLEGSLAVVFRGVDVPVVKCTLPAPAKSAVKPRPPEKLVRVSKADGSRAWGKNFDLHRAPALWRIL